MIESQQQRIDKAIKNKEIRQTKTETNIEISWAINCTIALMGKGDRTLDWEEQIRLIRARYQDIIDIKRDYIMEEMPEEVIKAEYNQPIQIFKSNVKPFPNKEESRNTDELGDDLVAEQ